jgi:hypothetical protein
MVSIWFRVSVEIMGGGSKVGGGGEKTSQGRIR